MNGLKGLFDIIKRHRGSNVIRKRLLLYFFISTLLVDTLTLFTYNNTHILIKKLNAIFISDISLTNIGKNVNNVEISLKSYLMTSHSSDLLDYLHYSDALRNSHDGMDASLSNNGNTLLLVDIKNMIETYLDDTDAAVNDKRGTDIDGYSEKFNEASTVYGYINSYIDKLKIYQFRENNENYLKLDSELGSLQMFSIIVILVGIVGNFVLIFLFAISITEPIIRLARSANQIAEGHYDVPPIKVGSDDEVKTLAVAFNRMAQSIRRQLIEIKEKAKVESQLKEQEMQNLKMKSMLYQAQLGSLQAQIDPHYMFNTLNAGMQLAMFEGAERTQTFMQSLSDTLRYSLGSINRPATLREELDIIDQYVYMLGVRFGDKITYEKDVADGLPRIEMPRLILQPIVENAFTHGAGEDGRGVTVVLRAFSRQNGVFIVIADNGGGMGADTIRSILNEDYLKLPIVTDGDERHFSIGLRNVIGRLMMFYNASAIGDVIEIESGVRAGTTITVKLPL
jgi:Predicted signal transduction protein with a C-terminal ATPase domain